MKNNNLDFIKEQYYKDKISYLKKEIKFLKKQFSELKIEKSNIILSEDKFNKINKIVGELLRERSIDKIYKKIIKAIKDIFNFQRSGICIIDKSGKNLVHAAGIGLPKQYYNKLKIPLEVTDKKSKKMRHTAARCVLLKKPIIISDRSDDIEYNRRKDIYKHKKFSHQFLMLPLKGRKKVWGVLTVATGEREDNFLDENIVKVLTFFVNQTTLAIENHYFLEEVVKKEKELDRYLKRLEEMMMIKDDFLRNISHELRTPIIPILGYSDLLLYGQIPQDKYKEYLEKIKNSSEKLLDMLENLIDASQIIGGHYKINFQTVDIKKVLENSIDTVIPSAEHKNIIIEKQYDNKPLFLEIDVSRTHQVFWNLLVNAVKFSYNNSKIIVKIRKGTKNKKIFIDFIDYGIGISRKNQQYIFEKFRQAESVFKKKYQGLGLGLFLAKTLCELQNIGLSVKSKGENKGSIFTCAFAYK